MRNDHSIICVLVIDSDEGIIAEKIEKEKRFDIYENASFCNSSNASLIEMRKNKGRLVMRVCEARQDS